MHGFNIAISLNHPFDFAEFSWKTPFDFQQKHVMRTWQHTNIKAEQYAADTFLSEKLWIDTDKFFIVTDGIITNSDELCAEYNVIDINSLIGLMIDEDNFFRKFRGNFCGFVYNKSTQTYLTFNNHTGTKKLFYFINSDFALFGTDLFTLHETLKSLNIQTSPNLEAAYLLLSNGFMLGDLTLISQIKQIRAGEFFEIKKNKHELKSYFHLSEIKSIDENENDIIPQIDSLFLKAVRREYDIDRKHNKTSLSTLSGGLDSRMTTLIAHKNGYPQQILSFSEKGYADEIISKQISRQYQLKQHFYALDPNGLCCIDDVVKVNDGLTVYTSASHVFDAFQKVSIENSGIVHTGMIGDAVFGSFLSASTPKKPTAEMGVYSKGLNCKTKDIKAKYLNDYETEELYKFYTRAFPGANNGFLFLDLIGESLSPFLDVDLLTYVLSVPIKYRYKEAIYIKWIKKYHPEAAKFIWEAIGGKPTNSDIIRFYYRSKRAIIKRLPIHSMWKNNMTPEQYWYDNNLNVRNYLDNYFTDHFHLLAFNKELADDCKSMYQNGNITEKAQVLTLLAAYKLLF